MIIVAFFSLISSFVIGIFSFIPNMQQYNKLQDIGKEFGILDKVYAVTLNSDRQLLFFTSYHYKGGGDIENSTLYRIDLDSNTLIKMVITGGQFSTPANLYIDKNDQIYVGIADDKNQYIYIYSDNLSLITKVPIIYDYSKVNTFKNSGIEEAITLGYPSFAATYILKNKSGELIATTEAYLNGSLSGIELVSLGVPLDSEYTSSKVETANSRTQKELRTTIIHDMGKTMTLTEECQTGSFSGFGCMNSTSHIKDDIIDIQLINRTIKFPAQIGIYDIKGRAVLIINNNKLYMTK